VGLANLCALAIRRYGEANRIAGRVCALRTNRESASSRASWGISNSTNTSFDGFLAYPDRLVFEQSRWTKSQLDDIASEIHSTLRQRQAMTGRPVMGRLGVGIVS